LLARPSPHTGVLTGSQRPFEAFTPDFALETDRLRHFGLCRGWTRRPDGKEELGILVLTARSVDPLHARPPPSTPHRTSTLDPWTRRSPPGCASPRFAGGGNKARIRPARPRAT